MAGQNMQDILDSMMALAETGDLTTESLEELLNQTNQTSSGMETLSTGLVSTAGALNQFGKGILTNTDSLEAMSGAVTNISNAIGDALNDLAPMVGGVVKGLGAAVSYGVKILDQSFDQFNDLADQGVIGARGLLEITENAYQAGLPIEQFSKMLSKNAGDLSFIYGTALEGASKFAKILTDKDNENIKIMRRMGYTLDEVADVTIQYQKQRRMMGFQEELSHDSLLKKTAQYAQELDLLAKLTGQSADQLQDQAKEVMQDPMFNALVNSLGEAGQTIKLQTASMSSELRKQFMYGMQEVITGIDGQQATMTGMREIAQIHLKRVQNVYETTKEGEARERALWEAKVKLENDMIKQARATQDERNALIRSGALAAEDVYGTVTVWNELANRSLVEASDASWEAQKQRVQSENDLTSSAIRFNDSIKEFASGIQRLILEETTLTYITESFTKLTNFFNENIHEWVEDDALGQVVDYAKEFATNLGKVIDKLTGWARTFGLLDDEGEGKGGGKGESFTESVTSGAVSGGLMAGPVGVMGGAINGGVEWGMDAFSDWWNEEDNPLDTTVARLDSLRETIAEETKLLHSMESKYAGTELETIVKKKEEHLARLKKEKENVLVELGFYDSKQAKLYRQENAINDDIIKLEKKKLDLESKLSEEKVGNEFEKNKKSYEEILNQIKEAEKKRAEVRKNADGIYIQGNEISAPMPNLEKQAKDERSAQIPAGPGNTPVIDKIVGPSTQEEVTKVITNADQAASVVNANLIKAENERLRKTIIESNHNMMSIFKQIATSTTETSKKVTGLTDAVNRNGLVASHGQ